MTGRHARRTPCPVKGMDSSNRDVQVFSSPERLTPVNGVSAAVACSCRYASSLCYFCRRMTSWMPFPTHRRHSSSSSSIVMQSFTKDLARILLITILVLLAAAGHGVSASNHSISELHSISDLQSMILHGQRAATAAGSSHPDQVGVSSSRLGHSNGPGPRHLKTDQLMTRLGNDFNGSWMSVNRPPSTGSRSMTVDAELLEDLKILNFSYTDEHGDLRTMPAAVRSIVERWLLQRASCPVRYTWEDMGVLFWPRWIKHGKCDTQSACSWPPGMHCAPAESDTIRLLHWQCRRADSRFRRETDRHRTGGDGKTKRSGKMQCRWKKVPYPVTSECFCSC